MPEASYPQSTERSVSPKTFQVGERQKIVCMHIPKIAGMAMRYYLSAQYPSHQVCPITGWAELLGREDVLRSYHLVQGHFGYNVRSLVADDTRTLIILRDPIMRTISLLKHLQRDPEFHPDYSLATGLNLNEMIQNPMLMGSQSNVQTRFLCASKDPTEIRTYLSSGLLQNLSAGPGDVEDPPSLELAIQRLEAIDFIGLTETLGADISRIAEDMSYHMPRHFPVINEDPFQNHDRLVLSEGELETLREHNSLDIQIYEFAKKLIERRSIT